MNESSHEGGAVGVSTGGRLESWKDIAGYLKRDVRTVQRWEKLDGLPIYRHGPGRLGGVSKPRGRSRGQIPVTPAGTSR